MKNVLNLLLALAITAGLISCSQDDSTPTGSTGSAVDPVETAALLYITDHQDEWQLRPFVDAMKVYSVTRDEFGQAHVRLDQTYHSLRVVQGGAIVHLYANLEVKYATPHVIVGVDTDLQNKISADEAVRAARSDFDAAGYVDHSASTPELVVLRYGKNDHLCWELAVQSGTQLGARQYYIDAHTGAIVTWIDLVIS